MAGISMNPLVNKQGFTLVEILIALGLLGVVGAFTIPKLIHGTGDQRNLYVKDAMGVLGEAYNNARQNGQIEAGMTAEALAPYVNGQAVPDGQVLDGSVNQVINFTCGTDGKCLRMGKYVMLFWKPGQYADTTKLDAVQVLLDTDGVQKDRQNSVWLLVYANGLVRTWGKAPTGTRTYYAGAIQAQDATASGWGDPSWISY